MQVLPRQYTDARTYNMLISVCVRAKDLTQALHAADMLESTGRKLDTILYTNLIGGVLPDPHSKMCIIAAVSCGVFQCFYCLDLQLHMSCMCTRLLTWHQADRAPVSAVCAAVGTADKAFQLYTSMKAEGLKSDPQVLAAPLDVPHSHEVYHIQVWLE